MQAGLWEKGCCCLRGRRPITRSEWYCCLLPLQLPASLLAPQYCTKNTLKKRKPLEKPEKHGLQPSKAVFWIQWDRVSLFGEGRKLLSARSPVVIKLIGVRPWVEAFALGLVSLSRKEDKPLGNPFLDALLQSWCYAPTISRHRLILSMSQYLALAFYHPMYVDHNSHVFF